MVSSTSSSIMIHGVVDDNSNRYNSMVMDAIKINQDYLGECSRVDKEPNVDVTRFFKLLKDSDEPLWDWCTNHNKLLAIAWMFTIKSYYKMIEVSYDNIIK